MDILWSLLNGFLQAVSFPSILYILAGVCLGLALGIIPGLGGVTGLTLLLPLAFTLDIYQAVAMMIALTAVTATSDTIPAVLLGVPGTSSAAATIVDGHPMAKNGEAAPALGAAFVASAIGGIFGAFVLVAAIPVLRPIVLAFGSPEIFLLAMWGLALVGLLGGRDPLRGWAAGGIGVSLAMIGRDPIHATPRFSFEQPVLWDGLPVIAVALGLFALPELVALSRAETSISRVALPENLLREQFKGIKRVFREWFLVLRCSALGTWIGFLPGLGGSVADWIAYGHAQVTIKDNQNFGRGDIRGVIAPESANNSVKGGELIPTIAFGVPGSASMALLFGALLIAGIEPGQKLLTERLDITMIMVWSLVVANIIGVIICLTFVRFLARLTELPGFAIAATVAPIIMLSTYSQDANTIHILMLILIGIIGIFFRQYDWPRPPLLVGFVLGTIVENNFVNTIRLFQWEVFQRPIAVILAILLVSTFIYGIVAPMRRRRAILAGELPDDPTLVQGIPTVAERRVQVSFECILFLVALSALVFTLTSGWPFYSALMPTIFTGFATITLLAILLRGRYRDAQRDALARLLDGAPKPTSPFLDLLPLTFIFFGWALALYLGVLMLGFPITILIGTAAYLRFQGGMSWLMTSIITVCFLGVVYGVYEVFFKIAWPSPYLFEIMGWET